MRGLSVLGPLRSSPTPTTSSLLALPGARGGGGRGLLGQVEGTKESGWGGVLVPQGRARLGRRSQTWTLEATEPPRGPLGAGGGWVEVRRRDLRAADTEPGAEKKREVTGNGGDDVRGQGRES